MLWSSEALIQLPLPVPLQGKRLVFVTNNSTKSRAGYTAKFKSLGLNVTAVRRQLHANAQIPIPFLC
jgi:phosphoglycolate phosphatase